MSVVSKMNLEAKRKLDRTLLTKMYLDDMLGEIERRGFDPIYGSHFAMAGRVYFLPMSLYEEEDDGEEGWETRTGDATFSRRVAERMGQAPDGQVYRTMDPNRIQDGKGSQRSGSNIATPAHKLVDRMQGGKRNFDAFPTFRRSPDGRLNPLRDDLSKEAPWTRSRAFPRYEDLYTHPHTKVADRGGDKREEVVQPDGSTGNGRDLGEDQGQ